MIIKNSKLKTQNSKQNYGQLLVEVLIGIGLITALVVAIIPLVLTSTNVASKESKNTNAILLAKEQIEAAKALKVEDWNSLYFPMGTSNKGQANPYHLEVSGGKWQLAAGTDENFDKSIRIYNVSRTGLNGAGDIETAYTPSRDDPSTQKIVASVAGFGGQAITIADYFTRFQSKLWTQTDWQGGPGIASWQDPPGNQYFSDTDIDSSTTPGALELKKTGGAGSGSYGNKFLLETLPTNGIGRMDKSDYRSDMRFQTHKNGNVNALRIYIQTAQNSAGITFQVGLQADNPLTPGLPSGIFLGSNTASFSSTGWKTITMPSPIAVTAGSTYHLVVEHVSGTINGSRYIAIRNSTPLDQLVPLTQASDNQQNTLWYNGSIWTAQNQQPIYVLGFDDLSFEGNPYDSSEARSIYGANFEGEKFTLSADKTVSGLNIYVSKNTNQNPAASLHVILKDLTDNNNLIDADFLGGADLTTAYAWKTLTLPANITLTSGHQFRLYFSSAGSASNRYYRLYNISNPDIADYNDIGWDGTNSTVSRSTDSGTNWTESNFIDLSGYYFSTVEAASYALNGELISSAYDVGKKAGFNRISFSTISLPAGTEAKFQLAANNDNSTWNYAGPQGTASDYYTLSSGENIWVGLTNNRYLRYKVLLATNNNTVTPTLGEIKINLSL